MNTEEYNEFIKMFDDSHTGADKIPEELKKKEYAKFKIQEYKMELASSDYEAIKYSEGWFTDEEYAPIKAEREALRVKIRELEELLNK